MQSWFYSTNVSFLVKISSGFVFNSKRRENKLLLSTCAGEKQMWRRRREASDGECKHCIIHPVVSPHRTQASLLLLCLIMLVCLCYCIALVFLKGLDSPKSNKNQLIKRAETQKLLCSAGKTPVVSLWSEPCNDFSYCQEGPPEGNTERPKYPKYAVFWNWFASGGAFFRWPSVSLQSLFAALHHLSSHTCAPTASGNSRHADCDLLEVKHKSKLEEFCHF